MLTPTILHFLPYILMKNIHRLRYTMNYLKKFPKQSKKFPEKERKKLVESRSVLD